MKSTKKIEITTELIDYQFEISNGKQKILLYKKKGADGDRIALFTNNKQAQFVFNNKPSKETVSKWRGIAQLIYAACDMLEK